MRVINKLLGRARSEGGFTMGAVILGGAVMGLVVVTAVTAAKGELNVTRADLSQKQAYEAARAGIADYAFHLNQDTNYWTRCANVPQPTAVNLMGSTAKRRPVPGSTGAEYAIELIPRTGRAQCLESDPVNTMIEQSGASLRHVPDSVDGLFGGFIDVSLVATFKRASFLDFLYFTQLETSDPVTYNNQATINGAYQQCTKTIAARALQPEHPGLEPHAGMRHHLLRRRRAKSTARCTRTTRCRSATDSRYSAATRPTRSRSRLRRRAGTAATAAPRTSTARS